MLEHGWAWSSSFECMRIWPGFGDSSADSEGIGGAPPKCSGGFARRKVVGSRVTGESIFHPCRCDVGWAVRLLILQQRVRSSVHNSVALRLLLRHTMSKKSADTICSKSNFILVFIEHVWQVRLVQGRAPVPGAVDVGHLRTCCRAGKRLSEAQDFSLCVGVRFQ